jgi:hypothetical protein
LLGESFWAFFENTLVTLESVVKSASLAGCFALAVDEQIAFWASDSDALVVNHRVESRAGNTFALSIGLGVARRALFKDAFLTDHGETGRAAFHEALISILLVAFRTLRNVVAFSVFKDEILRALKSFALVVFRQAEMSWALVEDASVAGFAPGVAWVAADFVALSIAEFVSGFALDSDA